MSCKLELPAAEANRLQDFRSRPHGSSIFRTWDERVQAVQNAKRANPGLTIRELRMICFEGSSFVENAVRNMEQ